MERQNGNLAEEILSLAQSLDAQPDDANLRFSLLSRIEALHRSVRGPSYAVYSDNADLTRLKATSALLQHNVIQAIPNEGFISARELAKLSKLEDTVIVRLMRHLTANGIIELGPKDEPAYAHTHLSRHWLRTGGPEYTQLMIKDLAHPDLGDYFMTHDADALQDPRRCIAAWGAGVEGQNYWEVIAQDPDRVANFATAMQFAEEYIPVLGMYPFERLVDKTLANDSPLIVDVGGGRGQAMRAIKTALPELNGRVICQDRPEVLASVEESDIGDIEKMPHDFFTPQPIKGARAYYLRRIFHDWDDVSVVMILKQIAAAMSANSRVLVTDLLLPDRSVPGIDLTASWMDYGVMVMGGKERTENEFVQLFDLAGLEHVQTWTLSVSSYVVLETKLKFA